MRFRNEVRKDTFRPRNAARQFDERPADRSAGERRLDEEKPMKLRDLLCEASVPSRSLSAIVGSVLDLLADENPLVIARQIALKDILKRVDAIEVTTVRQASSLNLSYPDVGFLSQDLVPRLGAALRELVRLGNEDRDIDQEEVISAIRTAKESAERIRNLVEAEPTVLAGHE